MTFRGRVAKAHTFRHLCWCFPMLFSGGRYPGHPPKEGEIWKLLFENQMKVVLPGSTTTDWTHHIKTKTQARNNKKHHQKKITTKTILSRQLMKTPNNCTCHRPWPPNKCICWKQPLHSLSIFLSHARPLICHQDTPCCRYICCIQPDTTSRKGNCMRKKETERYHKKSQYAFALEQQSPLTSQSLKRPSQRLIYIYIYIYEQALSAKE